MRWYIKNRPEYKEGDTRIVKMFALFPMKVLDTHINTKCIVWLEDYYVEERLEDIFDYSLDWKIKKRFINSK